MFIDVFPDFYKKCMRCKEWKLDTEFCNKFGPTVKDKKQSYCRKCTKECRRVYYRKNLMKNRRLNKKYNVKYLAHKSPELVEKHNKNRTKTSLRSRLVQRIARRELIIRLVAEVWEVEPELLLGRIQPNTHYKLVEARAVVSTLVRQLTQFHPDSIADRLDICTYDVARHGLIFRKFTDLRYGDILILEKINKIRRLYNQQREKVSKDAKSKHVGLESFSPAEIKNGRIPLVKLEYPKGISLESLERGISWFVGSDPTELYLEGRNKNGPVRARQVLTYVLRHYEGWTYDQLGKLFSKEHSTCVYNVSAGSRIISQEEDSLLYELNRVWAAKDRLVNMLAYLNYKYEESDLQRMRG